MSIRSLVLSMIVLAGLVNPRSDAAPPGLRVGAATTDVTPWLGISMNGGMWDNPVKSIHDPLSARAFVLDDGTSRLAFVVVDSCMIPREVVAAAKRRVEERTKIAPDRVLISATHAHSTPASCAVFQTEPDPLYARFLAVRIADAVEGAAGRLAPARIGWGMGKNSDHVFNRRWKKAAGTIPPDPFGRTTDRVQMNPTAGSPDLIEPAGPIDPEVGVLAARTPEGRPVAVLAAYGLHYVGGVNFGESSADYFGAFAERLAALLGATGPGPTFVAAMANGTSGDINNINFRTPRPPGAPHSQIRRVADDLAAEVARVANAISYRDRATLDAKTAEISLGVRFPGAEDVSRAEAVLAAAKGEPFRTFEQVYARETVLLSKWPARVDLTIQAIRIGELAIVAIPCEVFVEIGLEIKAKSPIKPVFTIELANGYNGYLPTKDQHALGGYETWRARSSYLEVDAADRIVATALGLLRDLEARAGR